MVCLQPAASTICSLQVPPWWGTWCLSCYQAQLGTNTIMWSGQVCRWVKGLLLHGGRWNVSSVVLEQHWVLLYLLFSLPFCLHLLCSATQGTGWGSSFL